MLSLVSIGVRLSLPSAFLVLYRVVQEFRQRFFISSGTLHDNLLLVEESHQLQNTNEAGFTPISCTRLMLVGCGRQGGSLLSLILIFLRVGPAYRTAEVLLFRIVNRIHHRICKCLSSLKGCDNVWLAE